MAKKTAARPEAAVTPEPEVVPEVDTTPIEDKLADMAKDQERTHDAYEDTHPPEPSL